MDNLTQTLILYRTNIIQMSYIVFGVILTWSITSINEWKRNTKRKNALILSFHKEIQNYRIKAIIPPKSNESNTISLWPIIDITLARVCLAEQVFDIIIMKEQFGYVLDLIKSVNEYNRAIEVSYNGFVNRFCNHDEVYSTLSSSFVNLHLALMKLDNSLSIITKIQSIENEVKIKAKP